MTDVADLYARSVAMALDSTLTHLFRILEGKGILTRGEIEMVLSDAKSDFDHPQATEFQMGAASILQLMIENL